MTIILQHAMGYSVQIIIMLLLGGLVTVKMPASAQISQERLNLELAQMDLIAQCDANLNWIGDNPADEDARDVLASCDQAMLDIKNNCDENPELTTYSDERIDCRKVGLFFVVICSTFGIRFQDIVIENYCIH